MRRALPCLLACACTADPCRDAPATGACFASGDVTHVSVGFHPAAAMLVDLDGDGHTDLVTAHGTYQSLGAAWGPDYAAQTTWSIGQEIAGLAAADLDHDGRLDLAATLPLHGAVLVSFGAADRTRELRTYAVGDSPRTVHAADLDRDGDPDLAVSNLGDESITVLLFDGRDAVDHTHHVGPGPGALTTIDRDADGHLDLLVTLADTDELAVLRGTGAGDFAPPLTWPTGQLPLAVAATDRTIAVANALSDDITIFTEDGALQHTWPIDQAPSALTFLDLDARPQLAVLTADTATLLDPETGENAPIALRGPTDSLLARPGGLAYVTRDGARIDLRRADGPRLAPLWQHAQPGPFTASAVADLDGDGRLDLAVHTPAGLDIRFADPTALTPAFPVTIAANIDAILPADLDGDDADALILIDIGTPTTALVLTSDADRNFVVQASPTTLTDAPPDSWLVADLDNDAQDDLLVTRGGDSLLFPGRTHALAAPTALSRRSDGAPLLAADIDSDTTLDLLQTAPGRLDAVLDPLAPGPSVSTTLPTIAGPLHTIAAADLDTDGHTDVILCCDAALLHGRGAGDGTFTLTPLTPRRPCDQVRLHDLDADGDLDLLATSPADDVVDVWISAASFTLLTRQVAGPGATFPTAGPSIYIHDAARARLLTPTWGAILAEQPTPLQLPQLHDARFGDLDGDGTPEFVAYADHHLLLGAIADPTVTSHDLTALLGDARIDHLMLVDLDADGRDDPILATRDDTGRATLTRVHLDPIAITTTQLASFPDVPDYLLTGDLDADARPDFVIAHRAADLRVTVLHTTASATLTVEPTQLFAPRIPVGLIDGDGDRRLDLWLTDEHSAHLSVARRDDHAFLAPSPWGGPDDAAYTHLYDYTGDGAVDLLAVHGAGVLLYDGRTRVPRRIASASEIDGLGYAWLPGDPRPAILALRDGDGAAAPLSIGRATDSGGYAFHSRRIPRLAGPLRISQPTPEGDIIVLGPAGYTVVEAVP